MKKLISCVLVVLLMACGIVTAAAVDSPLPTTGDKFIYIDVVPVPEKGGTVTPSVENPDKYVPASGEKVTLVAKPDDGYKFVRWEVVTGEFDIVEGDLYTSTIVIIPKGEENIRFNAVFAPIDEPDTTPTSKPVFPPDDEDKAPQTGQPMFLYGAIVVAILAAGFAVIILKKKAC